MRILFVCTGNSCRSPMAEIYFNAVMAKKQRADVCAVSAGLCADTGGTISDQAFQVMRRMGLDAGNFRSRQFDTGLADECDMIVVMSASHGAAVKRFYPECAGKVSLLLDHSCGGDVTDPYGGSVELYMQTFELMRTALDNLAEKI